eukprot:gb/GEZN01009845.1/.p1 GENE.gb/GEZN01009845.1/~~gb/GEZN01009845.1/.p1  ORF type:complete len:233 (+),score=50.29 gb/GEZN01009845.1/:27-725(+)
MSQPTPTTAEAYAMATMNAVYAMEKKLDSELDAMDGELGEEDLAAIRKKRMLQLKQKNAKLQELKKLGHGVYTEVPDQKAWFEATKSSKRVICHFYRNSNRSCKLLDEHLTKLAAKHLETRFIKIDAEKALYLSEHLSVVLIPTLIMTKENVTEDRMEGFDELGGVETFSTEELAQRLAKRKSIDLLPEEQENSATAKKTHSSSNPEGHAIYASRRKELIDSMDSDDEDLLS